VNGEARIITVEDWRSIARVGELPAGGGSAELALSDFTVEFRCLDIVDIQKYLHYVESRDASVLQQGFPCSAVSKRCYSAFCFFPAAPRSLHQRIAADQQRMQLRCRGAARNQSDFGSG